MAMNSFFSTSQLTISGLSDPRSGTCPRDGRHAQSQRGLPTSQNDEPSTDPFSLILSVPITPTLLLNAHAALNPYLIKHKPLLGDYESLNGNLRLVLLTRSFKQLSPT